MTLRLRLTLVAAVVVAVVVSAASVTTYFVMRHELYSQVDTTLGQYAGQLQTNPTDVIHGFGRYGNDVVQLVDADGSPGAGPGLPVDRAARRVALGNEDGFRRNVTIDGVHAREIVVPLQPPFAGAVIVAQDIDFIYHDLARLRLILILVSLGGVAAAALAGALVSRATLAPVRRLTAAAERIA
jgi:two-component system sensor histidine kinase MprB